MKLLQDPKKRQDDSNDLEQQHEFRILGKECTDRPDKETDDSDNDENGYDVHLSFSDVATARSYDEPMRSYKSCGEYPGNAVPVLWKTSAFS